MKALILVCTLLLSQLSYAISDSYKSFLETHKELICLTLTVYGEVGEVRNNQEDIKAVANVIMNRVRSDNPYFPNTVCQVVLKKNQFEPLAEGKKLRYHTLSAIMDVTRFRIPPNINKDMFWTIYRVAVLAYHGKLEDNTNGAIGFYAPKAQKKLKRNKPAFAKKLQLVAVVGDHEFYR
jgi:spore germination cell wall hydrolase CwlJ-like protein